MICYTITSERGKGPLTEGRTEMTNRIHQQVMSWNRIDYGKRVAGTDRASYADLGRAIDNAMKFIERRESWMVATDMNITEAYIINKVTGEVEWSFKA